MFRSIVFDLDGTLITCECKQKYALFSILKRFEQLDTGIINIWWSLKRNGFNTEKALHHLGIRFAKQISQEWVLMIEDFTWCMLDISFEDSLSTLKFLKEEKKFKVFLLSARKSRIQLIQTIHRTGLNNYLDDVILVNPQSPISEKAEYLQKIKPEMFIGDTEIDFMASQRSGIRFVALNRGQRCQAFLEKYKISRIENDLKFLYSEIAYE